MLHSFYYYVCYALLCLSLHHHLAVGSLTIIIDGATTNEWNTRDEYQRLMDSAGSTGSTGSGGPNGATNERQQSAELNELAVELAGAPSGSRQTSSLGLNSADVQGERGLDIAAALDQLAHMEREREKEKEFDLEQQAKFLSKVSRLHNPNQKIPIMNNNNQHHIISTTNGAEISRTLADLVPFNDQNLVQDSSSQLSLSSSSSSSSPSSPSLSSPALSSSPLLSPSPDIDPLSAQQEGLDGALFGLGPSAKAARLRERDSSARNYCGRELIEMLDLVCEGRFHDGSMEPLIEQPIISRRSIDYLASRRHPRSSIQGLASISSGSSISNGRRRRKLHGDLDGSTEQHSQNYLSRASSQTHLADRGQSTDGDGIDDQQDDQLQTQQKQINLNSNSNSNPNPNININNHNNNNRNKNRDITLRRRFRDINISRQPEGATTVCCKKACTLDEMQEFCQRKRT